LKKKSANNAFKGHQKVCIKDKECDVGSKQFQSSPEVPRVRERQSDRFVRLLCQQKYDLSYLSIQQGFHHDNHEVICWSDIFDSRFCSMTIKLLEWRMPRSIFPQIKIGYACIFLEYRVKHRRYLPDKNYRNSSYPFLNVIFERALKLSWAIQHLMLFQSLKISGWRKVSINHDKVIWTSSNNSKLIMNNPVSLVMFFGGREMS
jgi:hypothetical protein